MVQNYIIVYLMSGWEGVDANRMGQPVQGRAEASFVWSYIHIEGHVTRGLGNVSVTYDLYQDVTYRLLGRAGRRRLSHPLHLCVTS
jgi:hypothetical protein